MSYLNHENLKNSEEYRCGLEESVHDGAYSVSTHLVENFTTGVLFGIPPKIYVHNSVCTCTRT